MAAVEAARPSRTPSGERPVIGEGTEFRKEEVAAGGRDAARAEAAKAREIKLPTDNDLAKNPSILISTVSEILNAATPSNQAALAAQLRTVLTDINRLTKEPPADAANDPKMRRNIALLPRLQAPIKYAIGALEETQTPQNFETVRSSVVNSISRQLANPIAAPDINPAIDGFQARNALQSILDADPGIIFIQAKTYLQRSRDPQSKAAINTRAELGTALSAYAGQILEKLNTYRTVKQSPAENLKLNRLFLDAQSLDGVGKKLFSGEFATRKAAAKALDILQTNSFSRLSTAQASPAKTVVGQASIACKIASDPSNIAYSARDGNPLVFRAIIIDFLTNGRDFPPKALAEAMRDYVVSVKGEIKASEQWAMVPVTREAKSKALPIINKDIERVEILAAGMESGRYTTQQAIRILDSETSIRPEGPAMKLGRFIKRVVGNN